MADNIPQIDTRVVSGKGNDRRGYTKKSFTRDTWFSYEPQLGDQWPTAQNTPSEELYYTEATVQREAGYDIVTFHYTKIKNNYFRSTIKGGIKATPISEKAGYRTAWDHILVTTETDTTRPAWYEESTSVTDGNADNVKYKWNKSTNIPSTWSPVDDGDELYKGITTFSDYKTTVTETIYSTDKQFIDGKCNLVGFLQRPTDVHDLNEEDKHWLVTNANSSEQGAYYSVTISYEYKFYKDAEDVNQGWDPDLYG